MYYACSFHCDFVYAGKIVPGASERVNIVYAWVQQLLQERFKEKGLTLAAPVGSRMWQMLSEGYLQFEQCRYSQKSAACAVQMSSQVSIQRKHIALWSLTGKH